MTQASIQEMVRMDLIDREQEGIRLYGTPLHPYNGRSAILDAYQEALDLAIYLRQVIEEMQIGDGHPGIFQQSLPTQPSQCDCISPETSA